MSIATTNPATGDILQKFTAFSAAEISLRLARAQQAFAAHHLKLLADPLAARQTRIKNLQKLAGLLRAQKESWAKMITLEMGKPLAASIQEIEKCALSCRFYAEHGLSFLKSESVVLPDQKMRAEIHFAPIGVVFAVMPWNFPFWQVIRCAAPILLAGNSYLLKHASNVPQCALGLEKLFLEAGFEVGEFQTLLIASEQVSSVIEDPRVQGVTLTGSEGAGGSVASIAGKHLKKTVLELGGSDPFIVMPSAHLELAVQNAVKARVMSNGQSCIAAKRFIVHEKIYSEFKTKFVAEMKGLKMGDPLAEGTQLGPLVSVQARSDLHALVDDAKNKGALVLTGGVIPEGPGAYYPPTVIERIPETAKLRQEEAFGPLASLYSVKDVNEAFAIANSTRFGLGASFWSQDEKEIESAVTTIQSGFGIHQCHDRV